jgi:hypothetical protein
MSCSELIRSLLRRRELQAVDGRPLYAYRLSADERDELEAAVRRHYRPGDPTPFESMAFCLWAAIRLARSAPHQVNIWDPVVEGLPGFRYVEHYLAVRRGLNAWRRELLLNADERLYLVTLACEGGLPLRILEDDDARVTRFFRELLREHETFPNADLSMLARRSMDRALPKTLRNHVVGDLASRLIRSVAAIRRDFARREEREARVAAASVGTRSRSISTSRLGGASSTGCCARRRSRGRFAAACRSSRSSSTPSASGSRGAFGCPNGCRSSSSPRLSARTRTNCAAG